MQIKPIGQNGQIRNVLNRAGLIENGTIKIKCSREIVRLDENYPTPQQLIERDPNIRATNGIYFIKYIPEKAIKRKKQYPFVIGNDLLGFRMVVHGPRQFERAAYYFPEIKWMLKNTNYKSNLFVAAKVHPGMQMYFTVNWGDYFEKIKAKMNADGVDTTVYKPFVIFRMSEESYLAETEFDFLVKTKEDYKQQIEKWLSENIREDKL